MITDPTSYATAMDAADPLSGFRERFLHPTVNGKRLRYFCGNSLGLQPVSASKAVQDELDDWATLGVEGHFRARNPWFSYHRMFAAPLAAIVGALPHEVVCMNTLTVNLHLMMISFYRPTPTRSKVIMVGGEFPSDRYAVESQVGIHGFDPIDTIVEIQPVPGQFALTTQQIVDVIAEHGSATALILFSGVHFFTGQCFDMHAITTAGHAVGAHVGFDLAHAVGNVELKLHDWGADFAVWCSYKYLNSGPGAVGGAFVHERHASSSELHRLAGWWGNDEASRFAMEHSFVPSYGADGWQLSNAQVMPMAIHKASLDIFMEAGMQAISSKRTALTGFLEQCILSVSSKHTQLRIITPSDPAQRGAQLSIAFTEDGKAVFDKLSERGFAVDWRVPNVMRVAPAPLYTSFQDVCAFGEALSEICEEVYQ